MTTARPLSTPPTATTLDDLDRQIIAAMQLRPRASWQQLSAVLGVSESTVSRRAKRLLVAGAVRIAALPDPLRCGLGFPVLVQVGCAVGAAESVARQLATREDVRFLSLLTGAHDLVIELVVPSREALGRLVIQEFNQIPGITRTTTEAVIRNFKMSYDWSRSLLGTRAEELAPAHQESPQESAVTLDDADRRLIDMLALDGRMSAAELAHRSGLSESSVRRRVDALRSSGAVHFAAYADPKLLGFDAPVFLWLEVDLATIEEAAGALSSFPEVRYLSATAGDADLVAEVVLPDLADLYRFRTEVVGTLPGIRRAEVGLEIGTIKRGYHTSLP